VPGKDHERVRLKRRRSPCHLDKPPGAAVALRQIDHLDAGLDLRELLLKNLRRPVERAEEKAACNGLSQKHNAFAVSLPLYPVNVRAKPPEIDMTARPHEIFGLRILFPDADRSLAWLDLTALEAEDIIA